MEIYKLPIDHGFAWVVLLGTTLQMALVVGVLKATGLLFVAFQERFHSSSSMTSLISTVQNICFSLTALTVMTVGTKLTSCRNLLFTGSMLLCIAYIVTSQAQDIRVLMFSHGVLHGIGSAFIIPPSLSMVSHYFDKRRALANGITVSGGPLGGLVYAPLITTLLSVYGYQGCVLILAAIMLHGCVCGALVRPTSFYAGSPTKNLKQKEEDLDLEEIRSLISTEQSDAQTSTAVIPEVSDSEIAQNAICMQTSNVNGDIKLTEGISEVSTRQGEWGCNDDVPAEACTYKHISVHDGFNQSRTSLTDNLESQRPLTIDSSQNALIYHRSNSLTGSSTLITLDTTSQSNVASTGYIGGSNTCTNKSNGDKTEIKEKCCLYSCVNIFDYTVLKRPVFIAFLTAASLICSGTSLSTIFIAPYAKDVGIDVDDVAMLVTINSALDMISRIFFGFIADKGWLRRSTLVGITTLIVSVSTQFLRFYISFNILAGYAVILGFLGGAYASLFVVIIVDYMTLSNLQSCLGFTALIHGFSLAAGFYLVGYLRDSCGSYIVPYHVTGVVTFIGSIVMLLLPVVERLQSSRK